MKIELDPEIIATCRERNLPGDTWAVYQNHDLGSRDAGRCFVMVCGPERTLKEPPPNAPDTQHGPGWGYLLAGTLDLASGVVLPHTAKDAPRTESIPTSYRWFDR